jgi:hypothetical protein
MTDILPMPRPPWERRPGEPKTAYARFLIYRNLGPARSLAEAQKLATKSHKKPTKVAGSWSDESARWGWVERAHDWDISRLAQQGEEAVVVFIALVRLAVQQSLAALKTMQPKTWQELLNAIQLLSSFIPNETIQRLAEQGQYAAAETTGQV